MAVHYTRERSKYGTLSGSIIIWPVESLSPQNPNNPDSISVLPAGYLRCNGSKYNARDYPNLAEICGTGANCKFLKFNENDDPLITLGDDEFVVPDLGSKYPRPTSGGDAGTFNNILTETQNGDLADVFGCCSSTSTAAVPSSEEEECTTFTNNDNQRKFSRVPIGKMPQFTTQQSLQALQSSIKAWNGGSGTWPQTSLSHRIEAVHE